VMAHADAIEQYTGVSRERWFRGGREVEWTADGEFPGGRQTRTAVEGGACVFRSREARGCMLHSFALGRGLDYHEVKPMVCSLFPVTFDYGLLHPSNEIEDRSLQCIDDGPSLYKGVRSEIEWYFGPALVAELDALEAGGAPPEGESGLSGAERGGKARTERGGKARESRARLAGKAQVT